MLRQSFLWLSEQRQIFSFVKKNRLARRVASRFVAGETLESAIEASKAMNAKGIMVSLDLLGESVSSAEETRAARDDILGIIDGIAQSGIDGNVSVKLTQLGLDIGPDLCVENMRTILKRAREHDIFVRVDMESSEHTERTLRLFYDQLHPEFDGLTGVVIQSYLRRSGEDVDELVRMGARVRLCKGAYAEPASVAFQEREEVSESFVQLMEVLLEKGSYPGIATHDGELVDKALAFVEARKISPERFEFQMLYGVRRDLQEELHAKGFNMRVYIPFGTAWYPYLMRRLAERPANVAFMAASLVKETLGRR
jgi:proline dehydrogenase